jgi:hypothetical protein
LKRPLSFNELNTTKYEKKKNVTRGLFLDQKDTRVVGQVRLITATCCVPYLPDPIGPPQATTASANARHDICAVGTVSVVVAGEERLRARAQSKSRKAPARPGTANVIRGSACAPAAIILLHPNMQRRLPTALICSLSFFATYEHEQPPRSIDTGRALLLLLWLRPSSSPTHVQGRP